MAKSDEIPVTPEMIEAGGAIVWQRYGETLYPHQLEAAYRAMRALEPEPGDELKPNQFLLKYRPTEKIE